MVHFTYPETGVHATIFTEALFETDKALEIISIPISMDMATTLLLLLYEILYSLEKE